MFARKTVSQVVATVFLIALSSSASVNAADKEQGHDSKKGSMSGSSMEMHQSMMKDMKEMQGMKPSGNMDRDFAMMMRQHHMQAVKMGEHELKHGKDQKMRDMAQKIIDSQKKEIAEFDEWLKANPHGSAKGHK